jgi:hypothetical protein
MEDRMRLNTLVLVGYGAEDAALRLLLETLDADRERFLDLKDIYAIEKRSDDSASVWKAKGIKPIEFAVRHREPIRIVVFGAVGVPIKQCGFYHTGQTFRTS